LVAAVSTVVLGFPHSLYVLPRELGSGECFEHFLVVLT
jgi:hypothetical protein